MPMWRFSGGTKIPFPALLTIWSPMAISPPVAFSKPAIIRSIVVLPQPDGPKIETNSPSRITASNLFTA